VKRALRLSLLVLIALGLSVCGDGGTGPQIATISISSGDQTLTYLGETVQLSASAKTKNGTAISDASLTWSSSSSSVATVSATGLVTAVSNGTATITASAEGFSGSVQVAVQQLAATIVLTPEADTLLVGASAQCSGAASDAGGASIASSSFTWSSSDTDVATVDQTGKVTGVEAGEATITATMDGASGTATTLVLRPSLTMAGDTVLSGTVSVDKLTIDAGVTVTVTDSLVLDALGPVAIAGNITGDCTGVTVISRDSVTITGTMTNSCSTDPGEEVPGIEVTANGVLIIDGATIESSGGMLFRNDSTLTEDSVPTVAGLAPSRANGEDAAEELMKLLDFSLKQVPESDNPGSGADGHIPRLVRFLSKGEVTISGVTIETARGGRGGPVEVSGAQDVTASGGRGGRGGSVLIFASSVDRVGQDVIFDNSRGTTTITLGSGGWGGNATATAVSNSAGHKAPSAVATGGDGGKAGYLEVVPTTWNLPKVSAGALVVTSGTGGRGGHATATGADGANATSSLPAQLGGDATASGGSGGANSLFLGLRTGDTEIGTNLPGDGGDATAHSGNGGSSDVMDNPDGAAGGAGVATTGPGGPVADWNSGPRGTGGDATASGGNGGDGANGCAAPPPLLQYKGGVAVKFDDAGSDPFMLNAGGGIIMYVMLHLSSSTADMPGGKGGDGGGLSAQAGTDSPTGAVAIGPGTNGGDGGNGAPPGVGGAPGAGSTSGDAMPTTVGPLGRPGVNGVACGSQAPGRFTVVLGPELADGTRTITLDGDAPWVDVTGTVAEDGTVTASGRGTVAGVPDVLVEFAGTFDEDAETLVGDYSMDTEAKIVAGHPTVYSIDMGKEG